VFSSTGKDGEPCLVAANFAVVDSKYAKAARCYFNMVTIIHTALKERAAFFSRQGQAEKRIFQPY